MILLVYCMILSIFSNINNITKLLYIINVINVALILLASIWSILSSILCMLYTIIQHTQTYLYVYNCIYTLLLYAISNWNKKNKIITCKLAISDRPARRHTMLAGGFASASQRNTSESFPSSKSICGVPINRIVGASANIFFN